MGNHAIIGNFIGAFSIFGFVSTFIGIGIGFRRPGLLQKIARALFYFGMGCLLMVIILFIIVRYV